MGFSAAQAATALKAVAGCPSDRIMELAIEWLFAHPEAQTSSAPASGQHFVPTATPAGAAPAPLSTSDLRAQRLARFAVPDDVVNVD